MGITRGRQADFFFDYIAGQMEQARNTHNGAERSECLANAVAANGLLLRGMDVGFAPGPPDLTLIQKTSASIQRTKAFRSLMKDNGKQLARGGSVDALVNALRERDRALSEQEPGGAAIDVIRGVQAKVQARTAQPRDYAKLIAAHQMSSWHKTEIGADGEKREVVYRDLNRVLDGRQLQAETDRVMRDADFAYLMKHEKAETLYVNALRVNGIGMEQYAERARQLRGREMEHAHRERTPLLQRAARSGPEGKTRSGPER